MEEGTQDTKAEPNTSMWNNNIQADSQYMEADNLHMEEDMQYMEVEAQ